MGGSAGILRGVLAHNGARLGLAGVLDGNPVVDSQRRLALARTAVEGVAVQVKRNVIRGDRDVFPRVGEQLHRRVFRCCVECGL